MTTDKSHESPYTIASEDTIRTGMLEAMPYEYGTKRRVDIEIQQPEFTSLCPMTGLPDFGCLTIRYRPDKKIVELKSLKYYLLQYRNVGIFYEHLVNKILDDLSQKISPLWMDVYGEFTARGGITTTVRTSSSDDH